MIISTQKLGIGRFQTTEYEKKKPKSVTTAEETNYLL